MPVGEDVEELGDGLVPDGAPALAGDLSDRVNVRNPAPPRSERRSASVSWIVAFSFCVGFRFAFSRRREEVRVERMETAKVLKKKAAMA